MPAVDRLQEGQLVGRYRIVRLIGEGGMGAVYEAIHPGLKKRVAIKVLLPRIAESQEARVRFLREGEAASRINHPNVVSVFDVGEDNGALFLVLEYLEGRTLAELLTRRGPLDLLDAATLFLPVMAAVAAGHDCGVVHRDLKPQNIFLAQGRWGELIPKVLDFGVSKLVDHDGPAVTRTETVLGTACYMSPEQARGARHVDARSDQFTLGLILYEMLTARRAYRGENDLEILYNAAAGTIQPARELRANLPEQVYLLLAGMLAVSPADRYPSLREGARVLLPFASEKTRMALARDVDAPGSVAPAASADAARGQASRDDGPPAATMKASEAAAPEAGDEAPPNEVAGRSVTAIFPPPPDRGEDTTLRRAAVQSRAREPESPRALKPRAKVAAAIATAVVTFGIVMAWRAGGTGSERETAAPQVRGVEAVRPNATAIHSPAARPAPPLAPRGSAIEKQSAKFDEPADRAAPFEIRAFPPEAELVLDGRQPVIGRLQIVLPLAGATHELRVSAPGYDSKTVSFDADQPPPAEIRLARTAPAMPRHGAKKASRGPRRLPVKRGTNDALIIK